MEDQTPNTTGTVAVLDGDNEEMIASIATLLGPKFNMPRAGIIRPGIMRLKKGTSAQDEATYKQMVETGQTWDDMDKRLGKDSHGKSKLTPQNIDYFSIRPRDCSDPRNVELITKLYGDKDGKLRSIPVWFPVNEWWNIIPHSLRCFGQSGIKFKSAFKSSNGGVIRVCEYPLNALAGRRVFGGRQWGERPCDPNTCPEYQRSECKFGGTIQFYIPGVKGMGIWVLPTTSWYSLVRIKSALEAVANMTSGRVARLFVGGTTPFILRKVFDEISTIDTKTGQPVRRSQWLITLDIEIDMFELAQAYEEHRILSRGQRAAGIITDGNRPGKPAPVAPCDHDCQCELPAPPEVEQEEWTETTGEAEVPDLTPDIEEETTPQPTGREAIIERITRSWNSDMIPLDVKKQLRKTHFQNKPIETQTEESLIAIETAIIKVLLEKTKAATQGNGNQEGGTLV
jgi:hypothetical protein